ncbi:MAG: type II toxin-antitoxin system RelE/ParE family toxin [Ginsengibacter sp.]
MNYNISNEASLDLEEIWLYTFEHWSIEQADKYYNQLLTKSNTFQKIQSRERITVKSEKDIFVPK